MLKNFNTLLARRFMVFYWRTRSFPAFVRVRLIKGCSICNVKNGDLDLLKNRPLLLTVSTTITILILTVSGCIIVNLNAPTPAPTATPIPATTPAPTSTSRSDNIVGLWEGSYNSVNYSMQFFADGKLTYDQGGNIAKGGWQKRDKNQYLVGILISDTVITLNDDMNQFTWGVNDIVFTKKT